MDGGSFADFINSLEMGDENYYSDVKLSGWLQDEDIFIPSADVKLIPKLIPGMYQPFFSNERGYYCKQISLESDDLFMFTNAITTSLLTEIDKFWNKAELYEKNNLIHKRGILLAGYAGTGKTSYINLICRDLIKRGGVIFKISGPNNLLEYMDLVKLGMMKIEPNTQVITIIEDIDNYESVESRLLDFLDGQNYFKHHIVIATSNNTEDLSEPLLRPSRLDLKIEVGYPDEKTREEYFAFKEVPEDDISELVKCTDGLSIADLKEIYICVYILEYPLTEAVHNVKNPTARKNYLTEKSRGPRIGFHNSNK